MRNEFAGDVANQSVLLPEFLGLPGLRLGPDLVSAEDLALTSGAV